MDEQLPPGIAGLIPFACRSPRGPLLRWDLSLARSQKNDPSRRDRGHPYTGRATFWEVRGASWERAGRGNPVVTEPPSVSQVTGTERGEFPDTVSGAHSLHTGGSVRSLSRVRAGPVELDDTFAPNLSIGAVLLCPGRVPTAIRRPTTLKMLPERRNWGSMALGRSQAVRQIASSRARGSSEPPRRGPTVRADRADKGPRDTSPNVGRAAPATGESCARS